MKRLLTVAALIILAGVAIVFMPHKANQNKGHMMSSSAPQKQIQALAANEAEMSNFNFSPTKLTVKKGTTVTWHNRDTAHHNIVFDSGSLKGQEGKLIGQGETYQFTFKDAGTFNYHCAPHPYMKASVEVTE